MRPVVLVHGIYDTVAIFRRMKPYLERHRFPVQAIPLIPNDGRAPLDELAGQLDAQVRAAFGAGETIHLVGFSMGGLVSRYYVQRLGGIQRVGKFITIGTPHRGTRTAFLHSGMGARERLPAGLESRRRDAGAGLVRFHLDAFGPDDPAGQQFAHRGGTIISGPDVTSPAAGARRPGIAPGT